MAFKVPTAGIRAEAFVDVATDGLAAILTMVVVSHEFELVPT